MVPQVRSGLGSGGPGGGARAPLGGSSGCPGGSDHWLGGSGDSSSPSPPSTLDLFSFFHFIRRFCNSKNDNRFLRTKDDKPGTIS